MEKEHELLGNHGQLLHVSSVSDRILLQLKELLMNFS